MEEKTLMIAAFHVKIQIPRSTRLLACFALLLLHGTALRAQASPEAAALPPSSSEKIERLRASLAADSTLDAGPRSEAEAQLSRAADAEKEAEALLSEARLMRSAVSGATTQGNRSEAASPPDISAALARFQGELERLRDDAALIRQLELERNALNTAQSELSRVGAELAAADARPLSLADDIASQRQRADEFRLAAAAEQADEQTSIALQTRALVAQAAWRRAAARLEKLSAEQASLPTRRRELEPLERKLQNQVNERAERVKLAQARLKAVRSESLAELLEELQQESAQFAEAPAALQEIARENLAMGQELAQASGSSEALDRRTRDALQSARDAQSALRATQARLAFGGAQDSLGLQLTELRRRLESPARLNRQLQDVRQSLTTLRLGLIELGERRRANERRAQDIEARLEQIDPDGEEEAHQLREGLVKLFDTRAELLGPLEQSKLTEVSGLDGLQRALQEQLLVVRELTDLLDRHLLWTPSHEPIELGWLARLPSGLADLAKLSRYQTSARLFWKQIEQRPISVLLGLLLIAAAFVLRARARALLVIQAQPLRQVRSDSYRHTAKALLITVVASLPWVLLLAAIGWLLRESGEVGRFSDSLGRAVQALAGGVLIAEALRWLSVERGLGHAHFRWPRARRAAIRSALPWIVLALLPLQLVLALSFVRGQEPALDTAARLALIAFCLLAAWLAWRMLAPGAVWSSRGREQAEPLLMRRASRLLLCSALLGCALLAAAGYLITAGFLLRALWASLGVVLVVALIQGLIARWFLLGERRLIAKRLSERAESDAESRVEGTDEPLPEIEPEEIAVASINSQTRSLLRAVVLSLLALGLFVVWSDVLPAFNRLNEIPLWQFASVDADGNAIKEFVSLRDLLLGIVALLLTFVAARNLPALVEIALLSRINLDAPTRYAITSVSRYVIVIAGSVIGLSLLGLRWSQLQWMAAALSVGLGFGLQEIFANFVSGLILLFERPFRVGDVITIADQTGTVTRIRTRATTLIDWDGKEVVVPNKTFITERLINWTLSDARTRVIAKVGVAYGTPPTKVHALLQTVADDNALVLKDPPPRIWFMAFGASSLDFELRVFVESVQDRLRVLSELNGRIAELFEQEGIEIAFPQLDLHVRDVPKELQQAAPVNGDEPA